MEGILRKSAEKRAARARRQTERPTDPSWRGGGGGGGGHRPPGGTPGALGLHLGVRGLSPSLDKVEMFLSRALPGCGNEWEDLVRC